MGVGFVGGTMGVRAYGGCMSYVFKLKVCKFTILLHKKTLCKDTGE